MGSVALSHPSQAGRSESLADRWLAASNAAMDDHPWLVFAGLTMLYCVAFAGLSYVKLLWLDELITVHIARLNSASAILAALGGGADPNPPMMHLAVMISRRLFGEHAWAFRLPAAIGYWTGLLATFLFLKRRIPAAWAIAGTVLSMGMIGFEWSFEARSYALFYGFTILAFYCWCLTVDPALSRSRRAAALGGMGICLAAGLCANFFAALAFVPIAVAEAVHTALQNTGSPAARRGAVFLRLRWTVWVVLGVACSPLLFFHAMIARSIALYAPYAWNRVSIESAVASYPQIVGWILYPLAGVMILAWAVRLFHQLALQVRTDFSPRWLLLLLNTDAPRSERRLLTEAEAAGISIFVAYPLAGYVLASIRGGMLSARFLIPVCFGCAAVGILFAYRAFGHLRSSGVLTLGLCVCWFAASNAVAGYGYEVRKESFLRMIRHVPPPDFPGQPLAVSDDLIVLPLEFYAPPEIASRMVFPVDFPAISRTRGEASAEVNLWAGRNSLYHFPVVPLATLQQDTRTYLILTSGREWLVDDLLKHFYFVDPMLIDTESPDVGNVIAPLSHARPVFFRAAGDRYNQPFSEPILFDPAENIPATGVSRSAHETSR